MHGEKADKGEGERTLKLKMRIFVSLISTFLKHFVNVLKTIVDSINGAPRRGAMKQIPKTKEERKWL
jgi:hypothetical protein